MGNKTIGVISDIHFGDPNCKLVSTNSSGNFAVTESYASLRDTVLMFTKGRPLDYLVLNGDTLDFSINSFDESCPVSKPFFEAIVNDKLARSIIYIPGNHDKQVWDATEWQRNVIMKLGEHRSPKPFIHTQPAVIDLTGDGKIVMPGVNPNETTGDYGGMYIEGLLPKESNVPVYVVYPNLFVKTKDDVVLVTHGHSLEVAWVFVSELLHGVPGISPANDVQKIEQYNLPVNTLICTGLGMGGKEVTGLVRDVQHQAKAQRTDRLNEALKFGIPNLRKMFDIKALWAAVFDAAMWGVKKWAFSKLSNFQDTRYSQDFFEKEDVRNRFDRFYSATCRQASAISLDPPRRVLFGHTHEPFGIDRPLEREIATHAGDKINVKMYNSGGWLTPPDDRPAPGAEVFLFDGADILKSVHIP